MNPDFRYIKQAFNPVSKKWEDVKKIDYEKILVSKNDRGGKGGHGGKKKGNRHHRDMNPALMQKMQNAR